MARTRPPAPPALARLEIRDLVVIAEADLDLGPGLTAITGETGAGKTVLATALGLLAGAGADQKAVRPGAPHALVQAELNLPEGYWRGLGDEDPHAALADLADDPSGVCVARRLPASGRSRALLDGQVAGRDQVAALVRSRLRFSGQHEQRRLVGAGAQMEILDRFCGPQATALAEQLVAARRRLRAAERALAEARAGREEAIRERAALEDLVEAVDAAGLDAAEEARLRSERERLMNLDALAAGAGRALAALSPEDEGGALLAARSALGELAGVRDADPQVAELADGLAAATEQLSDIALGLNRYLSDLEAAPGALDEIEERLDLYARLSRRYGPGTDAVLARVDAARERLAALDEGAGSEEVLEAERAGALADARELAGRLGELRAEAAPRLGEAVEAELAQLAMPQATFRVELSAHEGAEQAVQRCRFLLRANPGMGEGPLSEVASGGELSRVLLALHGVAASGADSAADSAAWIFDEVDAGIGGRTAVAVAERLRALADHQQVIAITHLPQVAALADAHYRLVKETDGDRATTRIEPLDGREALLGELCRMLGAAPGDEGARRHAAELLGRRARPA